MNDETIIIILSLIIIAIISVGPIKNKFKIKRQVARIKKANEPGYKRPDDNMIMFLHNGVITYRKRKRK